MVSAYLRECFVGDVIEYVLRDIFVHSYTGMVAESLAFISVIIAMLNARKLKINS